MEHPLLFEFDISRDLNIDSFFREMTNLIDNYDLEKENLVIDGEYEEVKETERITDGT